VLRTFRIRSPGTEIDIQITRDSLRPMDTREARRKVAKDAMDLLRTRVEAVENLAVLGVAVAEAEHAVTAVQKRLDAAREEYTQGLPRSQRPWMVSKRTTTARLRTGHHAAAVGENTSRHRRDRHATDQYRRRCQHEAHHRPERTKRHQRDATPQRHRHRLRSAGL
jgi:hypothetical protein